MDFPASRLQADFGLDRAMRHRPQPAGVHRHARLAAPGARAARAEPDVGRVLCVTADRFPPGALYEQAYNLISDGAAACVVSLRRRARSRLVAVPPDHQRRAGAASSDENRRAATSPTRTARSRRRWRRRSSRIGTSTGSCRRTRTSRRWQILARLLGSIRSGSSLPHDRGRRPRDQRRQHRQPEARSSEDGILRPGERSSCSMAGYGLNWQCVDPGEA